MAIKHKFITFLTLAVAVFGLTTFVAAQETVPADDQKTIQKRDGRRGMRDGMRQGGRGKHRFGRRGGMRMGGFRGLNLTEAQRAQMKSIMEANRPNESVRTEMRTLMQAKRDGTITPEQQERARTLKAQGREKAGLVRQQMLAVLTPEQVQQMEQRKLEMKQRWEERRQLRQKRETKPVTEN